MSGENGVAVLGLGIIGSIWAGHYNAAGQLAVCWSRSPKPDLDLPMGSIEGCAKQSSVLQLCLYDSDSVRSVLQQLVPFLGADHTVVQSSTIDGQSAAGFCAMVTATGARYVEAPFTGSKPAAEAQKTIFFLGGDAASIDAVEPLLETLSEKRFRIGTPEQAASIKLAMNLQVVGIAEALCESLTLSRKAGVDDAKFFEVMKASVAWSGVAALKEPKLRDGDFSPQFSIKNMHKDMRLAKESAGLELPLLKTVVECLAAAEKAGLSEDDFISLIRTLG